MKTKIFVRDCVRSRIYIEETFNADQSGIIESCLSAQIEGICLSNGHEDVFIRDIF